jgi:hypothetical protein
MPDITEQEVSKIEANRAAKKPPRAGLGRPKGSTNINTRQIKELAQQFGPQAIQTLAEIMQNGESEQAKIAAAKEILDRGFGKAKQVLEHTGEDGGPVQITRIELVPLNK